MKSKLFKIFAIIAILSMMVVPAAAQQAPVIKNTDGSTPAAAPVYSGNYIVVLKDAGMVEYAGGIKGLKATAPVEGAKLNSRTPEAKAYKSYLESRQNTFLASLKGAFGRDVNVMGRLHYGVSAMILTISDAEARKVERMPEVKQVIKETVEYLDTDTGPSWIGAPGIWDGSAVPSGLGTMGEGLVVGIIDSGINSDHPSFADVGGDDYDHTDPYGDGVYLGVCDPADPGYDPTFVCNDKLVGAYEFSYPYYVASGNPDYLEYPSPEDEGGHGTHTASTTAGNVVTATLEYPTISFTSRISGVAPHASIISYDVCTENVVTLQGPCWGGALADAVDQSIGDGVDVINYSISGGTNPATDLIEQLFGLSAYFNGTFISTSAGNNGPTTSSVAHRSPWVSTVAASTHDRAVLNSLESMTGGSTTPPADILGSGSAGGFGPAKIVYAGNYGSALCAPGAFAAGTFNGEIVVCDRGGGIARVAKAQAVKDGGAGGFVLANDAASGSSLVADGYALPGVHISYANGVILKTWLASGADHMGTISGATLAYDPAYGDITASFSSRGPNTTFDVLKPDITAPGVDVWAAYKTEDPANPGPAEYTLMSGTSMSSPHNAGAGTLLRAVYPSWTHARLRSALMLTSQPYVYPYTLNASGAGRIDLRQAAMTGFTLAQSTGTMYNAIYAGSGVDPRTFNLASVMDTKCVFECSWNRTVVSVLPMAATYTVTFEAWTAGIDVTVTPSVFTLNPGASQVLTFQIDVSNVPVNTSAQGQVWFETDASFPVTGNSPFAGEPVPDMHIPVYAVARASTLPGSVREAVEGSTGSFTIPGVKSIEVSNMKINTFGLTKADMTYKIVEEDPTNGNAYDAGGTFVKLVTVPANTQRLVAEITNATSHDVDLRIGLDSNGDGIPQSGELKKQQADGAVYEYVNIDKPAAGTYWVLVQNWESSGAPDIIALATAAVPMVDANNMAIYAPQSVAANTPFDIQVAWDIPTFKPGDYYYGAFSLGTSPSKAGDMGTANVDIHHAYDAFFTYNDAEGAVNAGELVDVAGSFNGWDAKQYTLTPQGDGVFTLYLYDAAVSGDVEYKYIIYDAAKTNADWDSLNSANRAGNFDPLSEADQEVGWRNVDLGYYILGKSDVPTTTVPITGVMYSPTQPIYVEMWASATQFAGAPRAFKVDLGLGMDTDPSTWVHWFPAAWDSQFSNNDRFVGTVTPEMAGMHYLAARIDANWGEGNPNGGWHYADQDWDGPFNANDTLLLDVGKIVRLFLPMVAQAFAP